MEILRTATTSPAEIIQRTCQVLSEGGLVIFPTETTYGAGVDATQQRAVDRLLAYKSRREGKPLSIAVTDREMAEQYAEVNESAAALYARYLPGPVTVVSKAKAAALAPGVASEYGTVGVRIPAYPLILDLVRTYGKPITATSANGSGAKRPYTIQDIFDSLSEKQKNLIDLIIDAGQLPENPPSTVIDTTLSTPVVFRQGEVQVGVTEMAAATTLTLHSQNEQETQDIARRLLLKHWEDIKTRGVLISLHGSLGVGKTVFAKGIAQFLNIEQTITSPTYVYQLDYPYERHGVRGTFHHLDLWRLEQPELVDRLEIVELFGPCKVLAIEWPSLAMEQLQTLANQGGVAQLDITLTDADGQRTLLIQEPSRPA